MKEYRLLNKIAVLLCVLLLLGACSENIPVAVQPDMPPVPEGSLNIPYCATDSLNPYFCEGEDNAILWPLAFSPLYALDNNFTPQPVLAKSAVQTGNLLELTLQPAVMTAQGTVLSVADVLYSFRLAKESPAYKTQLSSIVDVGIGTTADVVRLTLKEPNINACNLLTFPIVQYGTADKPEDLPVGTGPYTYTKTAEGVILTYNPNYHQGSVRCAQITLVDAAADATKAFSLKSERIDCTYSSLADGEVLRLSAGAHPVPTTNLVFLGVNADNEYLQKQNVRQALSYLIDRQTIVDHSFCGYAQPTSLPVHPDWSALQTEEVANLTVADVPTALALFSSGESSELTDGTQDTQVPTGENLLTLRLVCCNSNAFKTGTAAQIKEQFAAADITVDVVLLEEDAYFEAIQNDDYDLYLGEVKLTADMNLSVFLGFGNPLGWGIDNDTVTATAVWESYRAGNVTLGEFLSVFAQETPFIPLCYRQGVFYSARALINEILCTPENLFANIQVWEKAETTE